MFASLGSFLGHTKLLALAGVTAATLAVAPTAVRAYEASHNPATSQPDNGDPNANFDNGQNQSDHHGYDRTNDSRSGGSYSYSDRDNGNRDRFSPSGNPASRTDRPDFRRQNPRDFQFSFNCSDQRERPLAHERAPDHFTCNFSFTRSHHRA